MSRQEFLVTTSIGVLSLHFCRNIIFLLRPTMSSFYVAPSKRCRDIMVALLSYALISVLKCSRDINTWSRPSLEPPIYTSVATSNCLVETLQVILAFLPSRHIHYLLRPTMSSFYFVTSKRCGNMISPEVPSILVSASSLLSQQLFIQHSMTSGRDLTWPLNRFHF